MPKYQTQGNPLRRCGATLVMLFLAVAAVGWFTTPAMAIPAWARKHNLQCSTCHTRPPRLNRFGEQFHEMNFMIPNTSEEKRPERQQLGPVSLEQQLGNHLAFRVLGNLAQGFEFKGRSGRSEISFPNELEIFIAANPTDDIAVFVELENELKELEFNAGEFELEQHFGLGHEAFLMINLAKPLRRLGLPTMVHGAEAGGMVHSSILGHGPMLMIGLVDPSTNFSFPTARQVMTSLPADVENEELLRLPITPYAFGGKFFGLYKANENDPLLATTPTLYNTAGALGADFHGRLFGNLLLYQFGVMNGANERSSDANEKKDYYAGLRLDLGESNFARFNISGFAYWGNDTARAPRASDPSRPGRLIDWRRYGLGANLTWRWLDLYGAYVWDKINDEDLPVLLRPHFDNTASGLTLEADFLLSNKWLASLRYDSLDGGGLMESSGATGVPGGLRANGAMLGAQARYYMRQNVSLYLRYQYNLEQDEESPLTSWVHGAMLGIDLDF